MKDELFYLTDIQQASLWQEKQAKIKQLRKELEEQLQTSDSLEFYLGISLRTEEQKVLLTNKVLGK